MRSVRELNSSHEVSEALGHELQRQRFIRASEAMIEAIAAITAVS